MEIPDNKKLHTELMANEKSKKAILYIFIYR